MVDQSARQNAALLDGLRKFARSREISEDLALSVYERERRRLTQGAKVERFLDILAEKRARHALAAIKQ